MQDICFENPCSCFYIDTENVPNWKPVLDGRVRFNDNIFIFSSVNSTKVSENDLDPFRKEGALCTVINCYTGKNAMDFQLVSLMGYMINEFPGSRHTIISADTGYGPVKEFWDMAGVSVEIIGENEVQAAKLALRKKCKKLKEQADNRELEQIMQQALNNLGPKNKSNFASELHNELIHAYGLDKGLEIYKKMKKIGLIHKYQNYF